MKLKTFTIYALVSTFICLGYVNQQVAIIKLSYKLQEKEKRLCRVLDSHRVLLYNNTSLKAPQYLAGMLECNSVNLGFPDTASVAEVRLMRKKQPKLAKSTGATWRTYLWDLFVPSAQAALSGKR